MTMIESPRRFYELVREAFGDSEFENALLLDVAKRVAPLAEAPVMVTVPADGTRLAAAALRTPPHALLIGASDDAAVERLVEAVLASGHEVPAIFGPAARATRFAERWARRTGGGWRLTHRLNYRVLTAVVPLVAPAPGVLRAAKSEDRDWLLHWWLAFAVEAGLPAPERERGFAERQIADLVAGRRLYYWVDGYRPVAMLGYQSAGSNSARIIAVRTDPAERGKGYAGTAVATLSQQLLAQGRGWCGLFADAADPLPNRIYARIGYRFACRFCVIALDGREGSA